MGARSVLLVLAFVSSLGACRKKPNFDADRERLKAYVLDKAPNEIEKLDVDFDGKLRLLGYKLAPGDSVKPGKRLTLTLYWRAEKAVDKDWRLYTHLLDGSGERIMKLDDVGPLRETRDDRPALPPVAWDKGRVYVDEQSFLLPRSIKTSKLQLVAGVFRNDERMKIVRGPHDGSGRAEVATLSVERRKKAFRSARVPSLRADKLESGTKIAIDGKLEEAAWQRAPSFPLVDVATGEPNRSFPVNATVRLLWDDAGFYVGFDVHDPDVVGGFEKGDKDPHLWTRDTVEIMVDPDGDGDNDDYYEIQINPQNLVFDSQFDHYNEPKTEPNGPFGHEEWSANAKSSVGLRGTIDKPDDKDEGYVVEALLPWKSFDKAKKSPPGVGDSWRLNFYAMQENSGVAWSPILNEGNFHKASRFGHVLWVDKSWTPPSALDRGMNGDAGTRIPPEALKRFRMPNLRTPLFKRANADTPRPESEESEE